MTDFNPIFASHTTSTAFNLQLSKQMIVSLAHIKLQHDLWKRKGAEWDNHRSEHLIPAWRLFKSLGLSDMYVSGFKSLDRRGLVEDAEWQRVPEKDQTLHWTQQEPARLTEAGELVYQLLIAAGLLEPILAALTTNSEETK